MRQRQGLHILLPISPLSKQSGLVFSRDRVGSSLYNHGSMGHALLTLPREQHAKVLLMARSYQPIGHEVHSQPDM